MIFLCALVNCFEPKCNSMLKHAPNVKGATLDSVTLLIRHGFRLPFSPMFPEEYLGFWTCDGDDAAAPPMHVSKYNNKTRRYHQRILSKYTDFRPNCRSTDLTTEGMQQHLELGKFYRKYLVDEMNFLPFYMEPEIMELRATGFDRCVKSGESFMQGLYPPIKPGEFLSFKVGSPRKDFLYIDTGTCADLKSMWNDFINSTEFKERQKQAKEDYKDVYENLNQTWDGESWLYLGDTVTAFSCAGFTLPPVFTDSIKNKSIEDMKFHIQNYYARRRGVLGAAMWREFFNLNHQENKIKFRLWSAHDTSILGIINAVGVFDVPPYRSHATIEIWKKGNKRLVRVVYNGDIIKFFGEVEVMEIGELEKRLRPSFAFCPFPAAQD